MQRSDGHSSTISTVAEGVIIYLRNVALGHTDVTGTQEEALRNIVNLFEFHNRHPEPTDIRLQRFREHATKIASTQFKRLYDEAERRLLIWDEEWMNSNPDWPPLTPKDLAQLRAMRLNRLRALTGDFMVTFCGQNIPLNVTDG